MSIHVQFQLHTYQLNYPTIEGEEEEGGLGEGGLGEEQGAFLERMWKLARHVTGNGHSLDAALWLQSSLIQGLECIPYPL